MPGSSAPGVGETASAISWRGAGPRARGRERLRQDHAGPPPGETAAPDLRHRERPPSAVRRGDHGRRRVPPRGPNRVSEPRLIAEPHEARRGHPRAPAGHPGRATPGAAGARPRAAGGRAPGRWLPRSTASRTEWRREAASGHRARLRHGARAGRPRRAALRAGRVEPGLGGRSPDRAADAARRDVRVHLARPEPRAPPRRSHRRHVPRPAGGAWHGGRDLSPALSPPHAGAALLGPGARSVRAGGHDQARGLRAERPSPSIRLPLPHPVPEQARSPLRGGRAPLQRAGGSHWLACHIPLEDLRRARPVRPAGESGA